MSLAPQLVEAAEFLIGNLDENGYLSASLEELADVFAGPNDSPESSLDRMRSALEVIQHLDPSGIGALDLRDCLRIQLDAQLHELEMVFARHPVEQVHHESDDADWRTLETHTNLEPALNDSLNQSLSHSLNGVGHSNGMDVAASSGAGEEFVSLDAELGRHPNFHVEAEAAIEERRQTFKTAQVIVRDCLALLQKRDLREISRAVTRPVPEVSAAVDLIRTLDPRPGRRYNREETRLIEPDVAFVKRGDTWIVAMNEEDMPTLRLSQRYRRMLVAEGTDKEVKDYVKERFRSAMQLMRNIAQRKSTILRTCEVIVRRQQEFLDIGIEALRPMMIKEVAEEIGVHPSTVSRAVANKYAHTPQGVIELRAFFSEGANGPEGADTPLVVLKRMVRKLIEEEDARRPLTDDQLAAMLQSKGIQVTRRTVAKYREDLHIPSTHQRRRREA